MKKRTAWILVAAVAAVAVGAAAVGALAILLRGGGGSLGANNYLFVRLEGDLPEQPPASDLESFFERRPASLRTVLESLERSAADPKVTGVVVRVSMLPGTGWGKVQELREAITRFRKSGKPAYAHIEFCGNKEYYLATACAKIYAVPTALVGLSGLEAEVTFLRKTLDKIGIEAQFEGVGRYKNAPNQFTETGFTEPHREQMEALLDSLHGQFVEAIAKGRGKTEDEIQALIDAGPYDAVQAKEAGLVDDLLYQDQIEERLKNAARTTPGHYLRAAKGLTLDGRPHVALVYAVGDIVMGESQSGGGLGGDGLAGSDTLAGALRQARDDDSIKAVVFRVYSPCGFGPAAYVIWLEVLLTRKSKPVVVSMGDYAASGGYYISMSSDGIVAQPGTITGSIGVFGGKFNLKGFYDKIGLSKEILVRGKYAALYSEYRPWTDEERSKIRSQMVAFYKDFVSRVAEGRKKSYDEIDAIAQGRVWTGIDAKRLGLVDELGGFDVALALAKKKAGIPKDQETAIVILPERKGLFEALMERQDEGAIAQRLPSDVRSMLRWLTLLGDGVPMARLPFELRIR